MLETFTITLSQTFILFLFIAVGYCFSKKGMLTQETSHGLSTLTVYVFLPCLTFQTLANNFKPDALIEQSGLILTASVTLAGLFLVACLLSRMLGKNAFERDIYRYSFLFPNSSYFGSPLILALYGEEALFHLMLFMIPFYLLTYTYGVYILNPNRMFSMKHLLNPILISMVIGMIVGIFDMQIPAFCQTAISMGANCMGPAAMILTGIVFASQKFKDIATDVKIYISCGIRMILLPLIVLFVIFYLGMPADLALLVITMLALPTGLNSIVFPEAYGGDSSIGAKLCFVSISICLVFLPVMYMLMDLLWR